MFFASAYRQLMPAEKAFVDAYIQRIERDATRANERISLALNRPISEETRKAANGLLERPMVCAAITERINEIAAANELAPQRVIKEYMAIGFASIGDYMQIGEDGQPWFDLTKCTPEQLAAIKSIEIDESPRGRKFKFVLHDKLGALDHLSRYMGLLREDNPIWRAENASMARQTFLPAGATIAEAADRYGSMLED